MIDWLHVIHRKAKKINKSDLYLALFMDSLSLFNSNPVLLAKNKYEYENKALDSSCLFICEYDDGVVRGYVESGRGRHLSINQFFSNM